MAEAFVLAHELGHAGHFTLAQNINHILNQKHQCYLCLKPSTMDEMLMANYLFNTSDNPRFKRWVIGSCFYLEHIITNMVYPFIRSCLSTREVYRRSRSGESLNAPTLNEIMLNVYKQFFGDAVDMTEVLN